MVDLIWLFFQQTLQEKLFCVNIKTDLNKVNWYAGQKHKQLLKKKK